jgi:hypothetical protein
MKTLIKVDDLELLQSINQVLIVQRGYCQARFHLDQLLPAIVQFLALAKRHNNELSGKFMATFQPDLF